MNALLLPKLRSAQQTTDVWDTLANTPPHKHTPVSSKETRKQRKNSVRLKVIRLLGWLWPASVPAIGRPGLNPRSEPGRRGKTKRQVSGAASGGARHLTQLERRLAPSPAVRAPRRPPPGAPRAVLSAPGGAGGCRAPASLQQPQPGRGSPERRESSPPARPWLAGSAVTPPHTHTHATPRPPQASAKTRRSGARPCEALGGSSSAPGRAPAPQKAGGRRGPGSRSPVGGGQYLSGPEGLSQIVT
nr:translation initiation factor IF-2-like [Pan paniscus]